VSPATSGQCSVDQDRAQDNHVKGEMQAREDPPSDHASASDRSTADRLDDDRRVDDRVTSVYRPVLIETEQFAGFCLVKNLSAGGMMGVVYARLAADQPVTVHFHPDHVVTGTIAWTLDDRIGVAFDEKIDVEEVLHDLASKIIGTKVNRAPRLHIDCPGEVVIDGRAVAVTVIDISQRGAKIAGTPVTPGDEVIVRLDGLDPHKADVRWTQGGCAGLNFVRPLGFEELARWVIDRQTR
jgi:translation initiation factor IF-1